MSSHEPIGRFLQLAQRAAVLASRATAGRMAHDVNNVLTGIRAARDWLASVEGMGSDRDDVVEDLDMVLDRLGVLAPSALAHEGEPADVGASLRATLADWDALGSARCALSVDADEGLIAVVDAIGVEAALLALTTSAAQAGATRISVSAAREGEDVRVTVQDDGSTEGMAAAHRALDPSWIGAGRSGLAGALARRLAQDVGGHAHAEVMSPGLTITLHFPVA